MTGASDGNMTRLSCVDPREAGARGDLNGGILGPSRGITVG